MFQGLKINFPKYRLQQIKITIPHQQSANTKLLLGTGILLMSYGYFYLQQYIFGEVNLILET